MVKLKRNKIALSGRARTGKDTVAQFFSRHYGFGDTLAFADPIKEAAKNQYPAIEDKWLYGSSNLRETIIPGAFKDGMALTVRKLLLDIGTQGREKDPDIWVKKLVAKVEANYHQDEKFIVSDVRFRNEFDSLKRSDFFLIRLYRPNSSPNINHPSETDQETSIPNYEFDYILNNNGTPQQLEQEITDKIIPLLL
jgi:hypothetical protein